MAEDINRGYEEVLRELFFGRDAALDKYAKVRHTRYEIMLWRAYGLPLSEVSLKAKAYFSRRFLGGQRIDKVSKPILDKALESLGYAAGIDPKGNPSDTGCRARCLKLVNELNEALLKSGFTTVDVERFINYFTFNYECVLDDNGKPRKEPGYGFEIRIFYSDQNRAWFKKALDGLFHLKLRLPMQHVFAMAKDLQKYAKPKPKSASEENL